MMRRHLPQLTVFLLLVSSSAQGRIVNTQDALFSIQEPGLSFNSNIALNWTTGTTELLQFAGALGGHWLGEPHLLFLSASGAFARQDSERFVNKYFGHLRYRHRVFEMVMVEAFIQGEYNEFRRLLGRMPCGAGPRVELALGEDRLLQVAVGTSYMYELVHFSENQNEDGARYADSRTTEHNHRWNNYLAIKINVAFLSISATLYAQPQFDDFGDHMLLIESDVSFNVSDNLSIGFSYHLFYDSDPPEGVIDRDTSLTAVLKLTFGPWLVSHTPLE